jgi:hypothetical protein
MGAVTDHHRTDRCWTAQPPPRLAEGPIVQQLVIDDLDARGWDDVSADMRERWEFGTRKYGNEGLRAHDGRNTIADVYEEQLDSANYLRKAQLEGEAGLGEVYEQVLATCRLLRSRLVT